MTPEREKLMDRTIWRLLGLILGALLGVIIYREVAHGAPPQLVLDGSDNAQVIARARVQDLLREWDHALDDRGSAEGAAYKGALATYLEGLADGYYYAHRGGCVPRWSTSSIRYLAGHEIVDLLRWHVRIQPKGEWDHLEEAVLTVLEQKYPCGPEMIYK